MPYNSGRIAYDADAHIMETPTWLRDHADPSVRDRIQALTYPGGNELRQTGDPDRAAPEPSGLFRSARGRAQVCRVPGSRVR